ncbi:MAG: hypothetical protein ABIZ04_20920 [Opitutus sp.]
MTESQIDIVFPEPKVRTTRRAGVYGVPALIRDEMIRHKKEGRPVYHPRVCRAQIFDVLADGAWHAFGEIVHRLDIGTYGLGRVLDVLIRYKRIEQRRHFWGYDPLLGPTVAPADYQGFQYAYRKAAA